MTRSSELKHISVLGAAYQVRVVRNCKERSKLFTHNVWGSKAKALLAAQSWRDQIKAVTRSIPRVINTNRRSTGHVGIYRSTSYDKRRDTTDLRYLVHFYRKNQKCTKTFYVGNIDNATPDQEFHAFRTAIFWQRDWDQNKGLTFNAAKYKYWKMYRIYENSCKYDGFLG